MFWGYTPALDLREELRKPTENREYNILLIGTSDGRHIIKTIAESYKYDHVRYNFYVMEKWLEQVARQILFFNIILEPETELGFTQKVRYFLELYGNTIIRSPVHQYLMQKGNQLVEAITDFNQAQTIMPLFNFTHLKYRERDYLENIFKFWSRPSSQFDIQKAWDYRVRKALGVRYDARHGVFDWDFQMRLRETGVDTEIREYLNWRETGVAFHWMETDGCKPNLTLAAGILANGMKLHHHGYLGDITIGPYVGYGSILPELIYQVVNGCPMEEKIRNETKFMKFSDLKLDLAQSPVGNVKPAVPLLPLVGVNVSFMTIPKEIPLKLKSMFDLIVVSNEHLEALDPSVMLSTGGKVLMETKKYWINLSREGVRDYGNLMQQKGKEYGLELEFEFDPEKDSYARFIQK